MKKLFVMALVLCGALFFAGCGSNVDENKTPEQIREEVATMSVEEIGGIITEYQEAIAAKVAELEAEAAKLEGMSAAELFGEEGLSIAEKVEELTASIEKLEANVAAYSEGLLNK